MKVTILIGPICTGKTTYINQQSFDYAVSSDNIVDQVCQESGISYDDFFNLDFNHQLRRNQRNKFNESIRVSKSYKNIVWDLTNLTRNERARAMKNYKGATFEAVEFKFKGNESKILEISKERGMLTGKVIPDEVVKNMFNKFEHASKSEGFTAITRMNMIDAIEVDAIATRLIKLSQ